MDRWGENEARLKKLETHGRKEIKLEINDILRGSKLAYSGYKIKLK